jgi:NitT/TauT family transport system ATP-binding protein
MSFLAAERIHLDYGETRVLERVSLEVAEGAFCSIVGASGCGKSSFLRLLLGQERPTRGRITLEGKPIPAEPTRERGIVFQRYSVFPHLDVMGNLMLGAAFAAAPLTARLFGAARRKARAEAETLLARIGLAHAARRYPAELSGGMQQRLAIAQSLLARPRVLLLDEPFGALDPGIRADMQALLIDLWRDTGMTVFMVTHDLAEAFRLGTRLLVFDKVRHDPQFPNAYGATITYDLPLKGRPPPVLALPAAVPLPANDQKPRAPGA